MLPCLVEASKVAHRLHVSCGFEDVEEPYLKTERWPLPLAYVFMRRPLKVEEMAAKAFVRGDKVLYE